MNDVEIDNLVSQSVIPSRKIFGGAKPYVFREQGAASLFEIKIFMHAHDRFLILDDSEIYHIGASLKDLGKKWFAFSKLEMGMIEILRHLKRI